MIMKMSNKTILIFSAKFIICFSILSVSSLSLNLDRQYTRIYVDNMRLLFPSPIYNWTNIYSESGREKDVKVTRYAPLINMFGESKYSSWNDCFIPLFMLCSLVFATPGTLSKKLLLFGISILLFSIYYYLFICWKMNYIAQKSYENNGITYYKMIAMKNIGIFSIYPVILWLTAISIVYKKQIHRFLKTIKNKPIKQKQRSKSNNRKKHTKYKYKTSSKSI